MSWRRFLVLLQGLGPNSVFVLVNRTPETAKKQKKKKVYIDQIGW